MVLREIGKDQCVEADRGDPLLVDAVRGNLHRDAPAAVVLHPREQRGKLDGARCGVLRSLHAIPVIDQDRAQQARPVPRAFHQVMKQERGGGLAVRAGHASHREGFPRMVGKRGGEHGDGSPAVRNMQPGGGRGEIRRLRRLGEDRARSSGKRVIDEAVAVERGAADGGEDHARHDLA